MPQRMADGLGQKATVLFSLKQDRGGIADIEFMVQYRVLAYSHDHPELVRVTDNVRIINQASELGIIKPGEAENLMIAYLEFRRHVHQLVLHEQKAIVADNSQLKKHREQVAKVWHSLLATKQ